MVDTNWIGRTVGHHRLLSVLGSGGMGLVFLADDTRLDRKVAVKFVHADRQDDRSLTRFRREALSLSKLNHPGIATVYDYDEESGHPYLVLEYLPGESLKGRLEKGPLEREEAVRIAREVAEAVGEAHEVGVIHRDLKPANIHFSGKGAAKVLDFGVARWERAGPTQPGDETVTEMYEALGTLYYMAPEQLIGVADARSDVFALGVLLYEMLTGERPFQGPERVSIAMAIRMMHPKGIEQFREEQPKWLVDVVMKCLAKAPESRYADAGEVAHALAGGELGAERSSPRQRAVAVSLSLLALTVVVAAFFFGGSTQAAVRSLAILPLEDLGGAEDREGFAEGLTDALIDEFSKLHALTVLSHTSVKRFADSDKSLKEIGEVLDVDAVLEGSVLFLEEEVQISVRLFDSETEARIWGETIQRPVRDLLMAQGELAESLSTSLQLELTTAERERLGRSRTIDPEALDLIFRGRSLWEQRVPGAFDQSIACFEKALEIDSMAAEAHAELARPYCIMAIWGRLSPHEAVPKAKAAATRALELDEGLAWPHVAMAWSAFIYDFDLELSETHFRRAIELQPSNSTAHEWFALMLVSSGRTDEAVRHMRRALELDEFSPVMNTVMGTVLAMGGRHEEAVEQFDVACRDYPSFPLAHSEHGYALLSLGRHDDAVEAFRRRQGLARDSAVDGALAQALAEAGDEAGARELLEHLERQREEDDNEYVSPVLLAFVYAALGEVERAMEWMEIAEVERDSWLGLMHGRPIPPALRGHPGFQALVERIGF